MTMTIFGTIHLLFCLVVSRSFIKDEGPWTDYNWVDSSLGVGVNNGIPYGLNTLMNNKIKESWMFFPNTYTY